jgi:hypothetical protein
MIFMVLTQTQIDGLQTQSTAMTAKAKTNFLTAVAAAATPNDIVAAVKAVEDELDALDYLNHVINREQELVDASGNVTDDDSDSDDTDDSGAASTVTTDPAAETQATTPPTETSTPAAETAAPAAATTPAAQDIINQATAVVQNNPALLQDIVNTVNSVTQNPELLTKVATALTSSNGDQNLITQGIAEVKNLLAAAPK